MDWFKRKYHFGIDILLDNLLKRMDLLVHIVGFGRYIRRCSWDSSRNYLRLHMVGVVVEGS